MDNASIHTSPIVKSLMAQWGIQVIYVIPYQPQHNGIEKLWSVIKNKFRQEITVKKIKKEKFKIYPIIKNIINTVDDQQVKKLAVHGW